MKFGERIRLASRFDMQLNVSSVKLLNNLQESAGPRGRRNIFRFDGKEYQGTVGNDGFDIRRRRYLMDQNVARPRITGVTSDNQGGTQVSVTVNGFYGPGAFVLIFLPVLYLLMAIPLLLIPETAGGLGIGFRVSMIFFLFLHGFIVIGLIYLALRRAVHRAKYDFERELYFLTKP